MHRRPDLRPDRTMCREWPTTVSVVTWENRVLWNPATNGPKRALRNMRRIQFLRLMLDGHFSVVFFNNRIISIFAFSFLSCDDFRIPDVSNAALKTQYLTKYPQHPPYLVHQLRVYLTLTINKTMSIHHHHHQRRSKYNTKDDMNEKMAGDIVSSCLVPALG